MFTRQGKIVIGLVAALLLTVIAWVSWTQLSTQQDDLALAAMQLESDDPSLREAAAKTILLHDADHIQAGLIHARALFRQGRYRDCHHQLQALPAELSSDENYEMALLGAQSLIHMARQGIQSAPPHGIDAISGHVTELLAQAASYRHILTAANRDELTPLVIRAMEVDTNAMYLRRAMNSMSMQLEQTRTALDGQEVEALGVQTSDDQLKLNLLDQELNDLCQQALRLDPLAVQPRVMLTRRHLRRGELDAACREVARLLDRPRLPVEQAVGLAMELLYLERHYNLESASRELALAQQLLARVSPQDAGDLDFQMALSVLKLRRGDYQGARELLAKVLSHPQYAGRHEGICLMGRILIGLGRTDQAYNLLARLNDRAPTWESKYVQGLAMIAQGKPGLDLLRQAQEMNPGSLEIGLTICQTIVNNAGYETADLDIAQLARLAPMHRQVMQLRLMLAANLGRRDIIDHYIHSTFGQRLIKPDLRDTLTITRMSLDDVQGVMNTTQVASTQAANDSSTSAADASDDADRLNPIMILAGMWDALPPRARAETARYLADAMMPHVLAEPLVAAAEPSFEAWRHYQYARAQQMFSPDASPIRHEAILSRSQFLPWPLERVRDMLRFARLEANDQRPAAMQAQVLSLSARVALWLGDDIEALVLLEQIPPDALSPLDRATQACLFGDHAAFESLEAAQAGHKATADPTWQLLKMIAALERDDVTAAVYMVDGILKAHPNHEPALLWLVRHQYDRQRFDELGKALQTLRAGSPEIVQLAQSRVLIARDMVRSSGEALSISGEAMLSDTMIRWQQSELEALHAAIHDQPLVAVGLLETLGLSIRTQAQPIGLGQVDLMTIMGRQNAAATIILQQLADPSLDPLWVDGYLARGLVVIDPSRLLDALNRALEARPKLPVLHYYKAKLLQNMNQPEQAQESLQALKQLLPDAPRTLLLQATLAMGQGNVSQAQAYLQTLEARGGENAQVARRYLLQLAGPGQTNAPIGEVTP